jgi:hypothetical protein
LRHKTDLIVNNHLLACSLLQTSTPAAQKRQEEARQLSAGAATVLEAVCSARHVSEDTTWQLLRPIFRLLLWLIPEHVPMSGVTPATLLPGSVSPEHRPAAAQQGRSNNSATQADWRQGFEIAYARDVATVGVLEDLNGVHTDGYCRCLKAMVHLPLPTKRVCHIQYVAVILAPLLVSLPLSIAHAAPSCTGHPYCCGASGQYKLVRCISATKQQPVSQDV